MSENINTPETDEKIARDIQQKVAELNSVVMNGAVRGIKTNLAIITANRVGVPSAPVVSAEVMRMFTIAPEEGKITNG